ncbi:unnamed protein product, partial [marine sediment metagenome]
VKNSADIQIWQFGGFSLSRHTVMSNNIMDANLYLG